MLSAGNPFPNFSLPNQDGKITKLTVVWDGSLLDDRAITALAAGAVDR